MVPFSKLSKKIYRVVGMGSKLVGCGSAAPKRLISNDDLAQIVETSDEWISVRTGIRNRRVLTGIILLICDSFSSMLNMVI